MRYIHKYIERCREDMMFFICSIFTFMSILCAFLFPNAIPRLAESIRDIVHSILFYIVDIAGTRINPIYPTVIKLQEWQFSDEVWKPIGFLPHSFGEFLGAWNGYLEVFFDLDNLLAYLEAIGDLIFYSTKFFNIFILFVPFVPVVIDSYKKKKCTDRDKKSPQLIKFERFLFDKVFPGVARIKSFVGYCKESGFLLAWVLIWMLYFNFYSIAISAVAFCLYFIPTWDIFGIYTQLLKLQTDLTPVIRFIPGLVWLLIGAVIYDRACRSVAFKRLYYCENANRAFLSTRGNVTIFSGQTGTGKTMLLTSISLTAEIKQFDDAFDIMLTRSAQYPNFNWQLFRDWLKKEIDARRIVDVASCGRKVQWQKCCFDYVISNFTVDEWQVRLARIRKFHPEHTDHTFGYDYDHYKITYNDELKIEHLFDALESYAKAYLIFTVKTTLLTANYSIRVDSLLSDIGNLPFRDNDFFHRDPEYQDAFSQHSHIIDFDMLRLGKKMIEDNPKARIAPFGVFVISEIDKERKNTLQLKETKASEDECNQKNDLSEAFLMMIRHGCVIDHKSFVYVFADLQRPEAWGANGRELGDVVNIAEKDELAPSLPFYSPFWFLEGIFKWMNGKWMDFRTGYEINRSDRTLFVYLISNIMSRISNHYDKVNGQFGMQTLHLEIQSGKLDGNIKHDRWRILTKKDFSNRYRTDCLASIFDTDIPNTMHIDDFIQYANGLASPTELQLQHSFFQNDVKKMKGNTYGKKE